MVWVTDRVRMLNRADRISRKAQAADFLIHTDRKY